jgi:large subunit ribosomal protein L3
MKACLSRKLGMSSVINDDGTNVAVTLLSASPVAVTQIKTIETDGYNAVQIAAEPTKKATKSQIGHFKDFGSSFKLVREMRLEDNETTDLAAGSTLQIDEIFSIGDMVDVVGTSKGKGWTGTIARHGFHRGRKTHGGRSYRRVGSIGSMYPQKIFKGKKMAGRSGAERVTVQNLKVVYIDKSAGVIGVTGAVPGPNKGIVLVKGVK